MPISIRENVPLAPYTVYKIGGPARFFTEVKNAEELKEAIEWAFQKGTPIFILGAGSNVLVADKGFDGLAIRMSGGEVKINKERLIADAGVMMARTVLESAKAGLTGFEWAIGVPGTIGGSVRGNAGCFGGEMGQVVERVQVLEIQSPKSKMRELKNKECEFSYRDSIFKKHPEWIIFSVTLKLKKGDPKAIQERIAAITKERFVKQDIGTKSCGCIFKNVPWSGRDIDKQELLVKFLELGKFENQPNIPASFLIDRAGLKGRQAGRARISSKHANYFVNDGGATAEEVMTLIRLAKDTVKRKFGILLEEEIQFVGF